MIFSVTRSLIIFLYLLDNEASLIVLASVAKDVAYGIWKMVKVTRTCLTLSPRGWPALRYDTTVTKDEESTALYDSIAFAHVVLCLFPMVVGVSIYSLGHYRYKSWWSWLVSSLADSMYLFGFAAMCPQIYVNYKLKSVAHLPVRALLYKTFITFVDDAFAFLVKMPLKHRVMTLRDDVVFAVFLYQWWIYPADRERPNEFGFQYSSTDELAIECKADETILPAQRGEDT